MRTISKWLKLINLPKSTYIFLLFLSLCEVFCFVFSPVSYAYIASFALEQNTRLALLWAAINFMLMILGHLVRVIKEGQLTLVYQHILAEVNATPSIKNNLLKGEEEYFAGFIHNLNNLIIFLGKTLSILIVAAIYSHYLLLLTSLSITICLGFALLLEWFTERKTKLKPNSSLFFSSNTLLNILWSSLIFAILVWAINLLDARIITLTVFLLVSNFISNHTSKAEFNISYLNDIKKLNLVLKKLPDKLFSWRKTMNKIQKESHTKKK